MNCFPEIRRIDLPNFRAEKLNESEKEPTRIEVRRKGRNTISGG